MCEFVVLRSAFRENSALESAHVEQQVGVVFGVDGDESVVPVDSGDGAWQAILDVPENCSSPGRKKEM